MDNSKKLTPEEIALKFIQDEHFNGDEVPEGEMWSTDHVVNLLDNFSHKKLSEKDALLKEAYDLMDRALTYMLPEKSREGKLIVHDIEWFINKTTGSEAGEDEIKQL